MDNEFHFNSQIFFLYRCKMVNIYTYNPYFNRLDLLNGKRKSINTNKNVFFIKTKNNLE